MNNILIFFMAYDLLVTNNASINENLRSYFCYSFCNCQFKLLKFGIYLSVKLFGYDTTYPHPLDSK